MCEVRNLNRKISQRIYAQLHRMSKKLSRQGLYEFLAEEYSKIPSGSHVLTVGSGGQVNHLLAQYAQAQEFSVTSFDIDPERGPDIIGDICDYDFGNSEYDRVILSEVLEHLHSPKDGLKNIYGVLRPGGRLILSTPFALPIHDSPVDYFRFTRYGLEMLLQDYDDVMIRERNSYFEAIDVFWVRLLQSGGSNSLVASFLIIPFIYYIKRPFSKLLSKIVVTNVLTTGYVVSATKTGR